MTAPRAVLFDLDGTLIDSAPDIAAAVNELLATEGHAPFTLADVKAMIGHGLRKLVERAFAARGVALDAAGLDRRDAAMAAIYPRHLTNLTTVMPGAGDAMRQCAALPARIAVVTNKPEGFSRRILAHYGFAGHVECLVGGDSGAPRKPAPDMLLAACRELGVEPGQALMVGDGPADAEAAAAAGVPCVLIEGGYSGAPLASFRVDAVLASLSDLPAWLQRRSGQRTALLDQVGEA